MKLLHQKYTIIMLIFLFLGTIVPQSVAQIMATSCPAEPSQPTTTYEFQIINGTTSSVCATTNINPSQDLQGWIFQPKVSDTSGNFTVTTINGPSLSFCAYESRQLVVTVPSRSSTGRFGVVFVSQSGVSVALSVRYVPRGIYRDILETDLRAHSSEPLWRAFGISVLDSKVCRRVGNNGLEEVSFLSPDIDPTTCLHGEPPNPSLISLIVTGTVPSELIEESVSIVLVTGSCLMPDIVSEPITITFFPSAPTTPLPSPPTSPEPTSPGPTSPGTNPSTAPTDSVPGPGGSPTTEITVGVTLSVLLVLLIIILLVVFFLVWKTPILSQCRRSRHNIESIESPPPQKPNVCHPSPGQVVPVSGREGMELTLSTSELDSTADSGGELLETDSGVSSGMPGTPKKSITVLTEDQTEWYQDVKGSLAKCHQLQVTDIIQPGQDVDFNAYSLDIGRVLTDPLFERLYVVWEGPLESKRSRPVVDPFKLPLLEIVNYLESRPNETEKVVFVQLGSSSRTLTCNPIKTICMEEPANTTRFSGRKCAQRIFADVRQFVAESTDERGMVSKSVSALPDHVTTEIYQQATSSWPGNRRPQAQPAAARPEGGSDDRVVGVLNLKQFANTVIIALGQIVHNTDPIRDIAHSTNRLADTSVQIADNTGQTAGSTRQTADNTRQTAINARQMVDGMGQVACNIGQMAEEGRITRDLVAETRDLTEETHDTLQGCVVKEDHPPVTKS